MLSIIADRDFWGQGWMSHGDTGKLGCGKTGNAPPFRKSRERMGRTGPSAYFSSFIFLQTSVVCPVLESIRVVAGTQVQVTVLSFSCFTTTQCWMTSAVGGGVWLRTGGGVAATGGFFAAQPDRTRQTVRQAYLMPCALMTYDFNSLLPDCLWQS